MRLGARQAAEECFVAVRAVKQSSLPFEWLAAPKSALHLQKHKSTKNNVLLG